MSLTGKNINLRTPALCVPFGQLIDVLVVIGTHPNEYLDLLLRTSSYRT